METAIETRNVRLIRMALIALAGAAIVLALGFLADVPLAIGTWPFSVTRITYVFLAAIAVAFALPTAWIAWTTDVAAVAGIGLNVVIAAGLFALVMLTLIGSQPGLAGYLVLALPIIAIGIGGFLIGSTSVPIDRRPMPRFLRVIFIALAAVLILSGGAMLLRVPNILPWSIDLASQQLVGAIFVGDAAYFLYAVARPLWPNAAGPLLAFFAYDVLLLVPLLNHASAVRPEHQLGLVVYVAVVCGTLVLAAYLLFIDRRTRIIGRRSG